MKDGRQQRVDREGSPFFRYRVPAIAAGGFLSVDYDDISLEARKYEPLDFIQITNNSNVLLSLQISPGQEFPIPGGTIVIIKERAITNIRIQNRSGSVVLTAGEVEIIFQKSPITEDKVIRRAI